MKDKPRALELEDLDLFTNGKRFQYRKMGQTYKPFSDTFKALFENAHQDIFTAKQLRLMIEREGVAIGTIDLLITSPFMLE